MANHKSAEKRARQALKRQARNIEVRSRVHNVERKLHAALTDPKKAAEVLSEAFSAIQKARGVLHPNAVKRRMSRLAKAAAKTTKVAAKAK
jgi:small subunit ribosomal protein S20